MNYNQEGYPQPYQEGGMGYANKMPIDPNELPAMQMQEERVQNLIQQIAPDNQLLDLQWRIKGFIKNPVTKEWEKLEQEAPDISPILVSRYISYLSSLLNQNTTLSNLSTGEINSIVRLVIEWLTDDIDNNAAIYGIKNDYTERTRIGQMILNNTFMVLKRAQNGMESRRIFNALNVNQNISEVGQKKSSWDFLKVWK